MYREKNCNCHRYFNNRAKIQKKRRKILHLRAPQFNGRPPIVSELFNDMSTWPL